MLVIHAEFGICSADVLSAKLYSFIEALREGQGSWKGCQKVSKVVQYQHNVSEQVCDRIFRSHHNFPEHLTNRGRDGPTYLLGRPSCATAASSSYSLEKLLLLFGEAPTAILDEIWPAMGIKMYGARTGRLVRPLRKKDFIPRWRTRSVDRFRWIDFS